MKKSLLSAFVVALSRASPLNTENDFQGVIEKREELQKRGWWSRYRWGYRPSRYNYHYYY
jgi:hypothetical protein